MAEEKDAPETDDTEDGGEGEAKKKGGKKKLLIFAGLPVILIVLGAVAFFLLSGGKKGEAEHAEGEHGEHGEHAEAAPKEEHVVFYQLPKIIVNIQADEGRTALLQLVLTLELGSEEEIPGIEEKMPRVINGFQAFLRELRLEDLSGSAGSYRLRQELLRRVNLAVAPTEVGAVLVEEMLVQ